MTLTIGLVVAIMAVFTGLFVLLPRMAKPTVPFGVRVPEERADDPIVRTAARQYYFGVVVTMVVVTAALAALALIVPQIVVILAASIVPLVAWLVPYMSTRRLVLTAKRDGGWFDDVPQAVVTDTTWRTSPPPYPWVWAVPAILIAMATLVIGIVRYPSLPDRIAVHIGTDGPDRFADTTVESAFGLVAIEFALTAVLLGTALLALRTRPEVSAAAPRESAEQYRRYAVTMAKLLLVLAAGMNLTFLIVALMMWDLVPADLAWGIASAVPALAAAAILIVAAVRAGQSGHRIRTDAAAEPGTPSARSSDRDDDANWIGGLLYHNREDPAVWVPKRYGGVGWTINFARPMAWVLTGGFLVVIIGVVVWSIQAESDSEPAGEPTAGATEPVPAGVDLTSLDGTPVGDRLDWVLAALAAGPPTEVELEDAFDQSMLAEVPAPDLQAAFARFAADYEVTALHSASPTQLVAEIDDGAGQRWQLQLAVTDADEPQITGLLFQPPLDETRSFAGWDEAGDALAGLADEVGYLAAEVDGAACEPIVEQNADVRAPVGSMFKLYVLGAVADAVAAGELSWDDEVTIEDELKSLPTGRLQDAEAGSTVTVAEAAELMISISDNTATDHLIALVGRDQVEQAQAGYGHGEPEVNRPFLTTREMFRLKWGVDDATRAAYLEADEAGRRSMLEELAGEPLDVAAADVTTPVATDTIEWFASPSELCTALARLDAAGVEQEPVRAALGANPIVRLDSDVWSRTAAKGGSEPGVLSFAWLLERASDGRTFVFAITLHGDAVIDQNAVVPAVEGAINLLAE